MQIKSYKYIVGDAVVDGTVQISTLKRDKHMTAQYLKLLDEYIPGIEWSGSKRALLYAGGPVLHHSDMRNIKDIAPKESIVIKSQMGNNVYQVAKKLDGIEYVSSNGNTCASSVYAVLEAMRLMREGCTDVVVYAEELIDETLKLLFSQLNIDLVCGDGVCMMHFTNEPGGTQVTGGRWMWSEEKSPMVVSVEGYSKLLANYGDVDFVKMHASGTEVNDRVEGEVVQTAFGDVKTYKYKGTIGHTQGASALIELGMLLDSDAVGRGVLVASGLGGVYGTLDITI